MATSYTFRPIITSGLILSLDAENTKSYVSGSNWYDLTSNNNNGVLTNSPTFEFNGVASFIFNGVDNYVVTDNIYGPTEFTICVWCKVDYANSDTYARIVEKGFNSEWSLNLNKGVPNDKFNFQYFDNANIVISNTSVNPTKYQYVVCTIQDNGGGNKTGTIYVDGVFDNSGTRNATLSGQNAPITIGGQVNELTIASLKGNISVVQYYGRVLTPKEVLQNYNALKHRFDIPTPTIVTDGLVLYLDAGNPASYPGTGTTWYDLTTNGIDGTLIDSPTFNTNNGGYLSFDGISQYVDISSIGPYLTNTSNFSYCTTLKFNGSVFTNLHFFSYGDPGSYPDDLTFFYYTGNLIALQINNLSDGTAFITYGPNVWVHLTVVYDGTQVGNQNRMKFYIDGVQQTLTFDYTVPATTSPNVYSSAWIGGYSTNNYNFLNFDTSVVTIYNKSLSDSEVLQNYNAIKNRY